MEKEYKEFFLFYNSWGEVLMTLDNDIRLELYDTIYNYSTGKINSVDNLSYAAKIAFSFIQQDIDRVKKRYEINRENGKEGGAPKGSRNNPNGRRGKQLTETNQNKPELTETNQNQGKLTKVKVKVKEQVKVKVKEEVKVNGDKKIPYHTIVELWNSICVDFPKVQALTDKRKQKIQSRLEEMTSDPEQYTSQASLLFQRIQASDFLKGKNNNNWQATFDWVFSNSENWVKVMEGNYDNRTYPTPAPKPEPQIAKPRLGIDEYIDETGRRTYGSGRATIPMDAPARPSARYYWNNETQQWTI